MEEKKIFEVTKSLIQSQFGLAPNAAQDEAELLEILSQFVAFLLEKHLERLFSGLYRLDIDERKVKFALSTLSKEQPSVAIAKLIIQRQKQKAISRLLYNSEESDGFFD